MRPSHRLDLLLVPALTGPEARAAADRLHGRLHAEGVVLAGGAPGPHAAHWVAGGFRRWWIDDPGQAVLYANRQGGFSARCPEGGAVVTEAFSQALSAHRAGGPASMPCPACGATHPLTAVEGRPPFAFGTLAVVTSDAGSTRLAPEALAWVAELLGEARTVLRRG